jgi:hypothetical protein
MNRERTTTTALRSEKPNPSVLEFVGDIPAYFVSYRDKYSLDTFARFLNSLFSQLNDGKPLLEEFYDPVSQSKPAVTSVTSSGLAGTSALGSGSLYAGGATSLGASG